MRGYSLALAVAVAAATPLGAAELNDYPTTARADYVFACMKILWWEGGTAKHFMINLEKWNTLPKTYQAIVTAAVGFANVDQTGRYDARNSAALKRLVRVHSYDHTRSQLWKRV
jgi:Bacterial extracellular solute-binding protein, family 7